MSVRTTTLLKVYAATFGLLLAVYILLIVGEGGMSADEQKLASLTQDIAGYTSLAAGAFFGALSTLMDKDQRKPDQ